MTLYTKRPEVVSAVKYGEQNGSYSDAAVARVAAFILDLPEGTDPTPEQIDQAVIKFSPWNPPESVCIGPVEQDWTVAWLGDYFVRDVEGQIRIIRGRAFELRYEMSPPPDDQQEASA